MLGSYAIRIRLSGLLLLVACGGGSQPPAAAATATPPADAAAAVAAASAAQPKMPESLKLEQRDIDQLIGAAQDLHHLGISMGDDDNATDADELAANAQAMAILKQHGFDLPRFQQVTYSVLMAFAAEEMKAKQAEFDDAKAKLEAMKASMRKEQYDAMVKMQEESMANVTNQPPGNVELVQRNKERIMSAFGK